MVGRVLRKCSRSPKSGVLSVLALALIAYAVNQSASTATGAPGAQTTVPAVLPPPTPPPMPPPPPATAAPTPRPTRKRYANGCSPRCDAADLAGEFVGDTFVPHDGCHYHVFSDSEITSSLRGKWIYFAGDSSTRGIVLALHYILGNVDQKKFDREAMKWFGSDTGKISSEMHHGYLDAIVTDGKIVWANSKSHGKIPGTTMIPQREEMLDDDQVAAVNKHWTPTSIRLTFRMFTRSRYGAESFTDFHTLKSKYKTAPTMPHTVYFQTGAWDYTFHMNGKLSLQNLPLDLEATLGKVEAATDKATHLILSTPPYPLPRRWNYPVATGKVCCGGLGNESWRHDPLVPAMRHGKSNSFRDEKPEFGAMCQKIAEKLGEPSMDKSIAGYALKKAAAEHNGELDVDQAIEWLFAHPATEGEPELFALRTHPHFKFLNRYTTGRAYKNAIQAKTKGAGACSVCDPWYHAPHFVNMWDLQKMLNVVFPDTSPGYEEHAPDGVCDEVVSLADRNDCCGCDKYHSRFAKGRVLFWANRCVFKSTKKKVPAGG